MASMNGFGRKAWAAAVLAAVVVPILACSGAADIETPTDAPPPTDGATTGKAGKHGKGPVDDPATVVLGNWKLQPDDASLRELKILDAALDTSMTRDQFKNKLKPPPNPSELSEYDTLAAAVKSDPSSAEVQEARNTIATMKSEEVTVTSSNVTRSSSIGSETWTYAVLSSSTDKLSIKLNESDETMDFSFDGPDLMRMHLTSATETLDQRFKRKK